MMKTLLVMEDDSRIATALAIRLEEAGYKVLTAPDGLSGLKLAIGEKPDLIVSDIWMPIGLGFSIAQRLKELKLGGIPVIFITAGKQAGLREAARGIGGVAFFEKPYDFEELLGAIAKALGKASQTQGCELTERAALEPR